MMMQQFDINSGSKQIQTPAKKLNHDFGLAANTFF